MIELSRFAYMVWLLALAPAAVSQLSRSEPTNPSDRVLLRAERRYRSMCRFSLLCLVILAFEHVAWVWWWMR